MTGGGGDDALITWDSHDVSNGSSVESEERGQCVLDVHEVYCTLSDSEYRQSTLIVVVIDR